MRLRGLMTVFIWLFFGFYFMRSVRAKVKQLCPGGSRNIFGGRRKRNIQTMEEDFSLLLLWCSVKLLDECLTFTCQAFNDYLGNK